MVGHIKSTLFLLLSSMPLQLQVDSFLLCILRGLLTLSIRSSRQRPGRRGLAQWEHGLQFLFL